MSPGDLEQLSPTARDLYDDDRLGHHARILTVATSFVEKTVICGRRLVLLNRHAISARRGLMVSGLPGTGRTSAITRLGRSHELLDRARHPNIADRIPVLYITVPPTATARMVAAEFARFLGLPVRGRSNMTDIIEAVVGVCTDTRTGLVLVDEIHNVSQVTRAGGEVSDTLKYFSERIPATFVYAGIGLETSELLAGTRGAQIAGRFTLVPTRPFPYGDEWKRLVVTSRTSATPAPSPWPTARTWPSASARLPSPGPRPSVTCPDATNCPPKTIRTILEMPAPSTYRSRKGPRTGQPARRPAPAINDSTRTLIDAMLAQRLDLREIWNRLMDDHDVSVSYSSINVYFQSRPHVERHAIPHQQRQLPHASVRP